MNAHKSRNGTIREPMPFESWSEAMDCCRERNVPIVAVVFGEVCKCFPSGRGEVIRPATKLGRRQEDSDQFDASCERRYDD